MSEVEKLILMNQGVIMKALAILLRKSGYAATAEEIETQAKKMAREIMTS